MDHVDQQTSAHDESERSELPLRVIDLKRKNKQQRTINDYVEDVFRRIYEMPEFHALLVAVKNDEAVEGSVPADNFSAAQMIRNLAREEDEHHPLAGEKIAAISKSLNVVCRRYSIGRKERLAIRGRENGSGESSDE